jgi:hypothetical protein
MKKKEQRNISPSAIVGYATFQPFNELCAFFLLLKELKKLFTEKSPLVVLITLI